MRKILRSKRIWFLVIISLGIGVFWNSRQDSRAVSETAVVERRLLTDVLIVAGEVKAKNVAVLNFPAPGKVWFVNVKVGDKVRKGQSLAGIDPRALSAAQQNAYLVYLAAEANAQEVEDSVKGHDNDESFSQKNDRMAAQTARDRAYNTWQQAIVDHKNANILAPFSGIVTEMTVTTAGDTVGLSDSITIVDPDKLYFEFEVDEVDIDLIKVGERVDIKLDSFPDEMLSGRVDMIDLVSHVGDTGATAYGVKVEFLENPSLALRVGMNGEATITLKNVEGALSLPSDAVVDGKVRVQEGQEVVERQVVTGLETDDYIEILSGVDAGDVVIVD